MRDIATFEAKCANCGQCFAHPSLGDFAYGEVLLCSMDGRHYAAVSALTDFCTRVHLLSGPTTSFWSIVAALADPVLDQPLSPSIHCPHCRSTKLEYWDGKKLGVMQVPEATFRFAAALSPGELEQRVSAVGTQAGQRD